MTTFLLLLYSLLPGFAKLIGNQLPMIFNIPILIALFLTNQKKIKLRRIDNYVLAFIGYAIFISLISLFYLPSQPVTIFMGIYMYIIPILGYFFAYLLDFNEVIKALKVIAITHVLFAIFIYPLTPIYPYIAVFASLFRTGVFGERMTSVSGSLGLSSLMLICFACFFFNLKTIKDIIILLLTLIGLIFAQQRGAWLGAILILVVNGLELIKTGHFKIKSSTLSRGFLIFVFGIVLIASGVFKVESLIERYQDPFGEQAVGERQNQWEDGFDNLFRYPLGTGVGQVGQVARVGGWSAFKACPDGDYPRVFSETGTPGVLFYVLIFTLVAFIFFYSKFNNIAVKTGFFVFVGLSVQMIGSNVTEFYFVNFLYWLFVGYMLSDLKTRNSKLVIT
ncbi:MAG: O-antigen ligase family protein [Candidatus Azobacteroides sp.]|nr:O-antigen ligase family protein [Candidatus Azobacteroides sp.]